MTHSSTNTQLIINPELVFGAWASEATCPILTMHSFLYILSAATFMVGIHPVCSKGKNIVWANHAVSEYARK